MVTDLCGDNVVSGAMVRCVAMKRATPKLS